MTEVPFQLTTGSQPLALVPAQVNGQGPFTLILDTGAGTTILDTRFAEELGLQAGDVEKGRGAGGEVEARKATLDSLAVGAARVDNLPIGIADVSGIGRAVRAELHGALGCDFYRRFVTTIDYPRRRVRFDRPGAVERVGPAALAGIPFEVANPEAPLAIVLPT